MDSIPSLMSRAVLSCMCASKPAGAYRIGWRETQRKRVYDADIYTDSTAVRTRKAEYSQNHRQNLKRNQEELKIPLCALFPKQKGFQYPLC